MPPIRIMELDDNDKITDALDSWAVIVPITCEIAGGIIGYTVGAEPESLVQKLNELNDDTRSDEEKSENGMRFQVAEMCTDETNQADYEKSARNPHGKKGLVAVAHYERCRVLVYALRDYTQLFLNACRAMG